MALMKNGWIYDSFYKCKEHYVNDVLHNDNGPAAIHDSGDEYWYKNGLHHREDGPASISSFFEVAWFYEGKRITCSSNEEFLKIIKYKAFW